MFVPNAPERPRPPVVVAALVLGLVLCAPALAQPAVSSQGAVDAALGPAAKPQVVARPAAPTVVTPSIAGDSSDTAALDSAIAAGDIRKALDLGATPADIVRMAQASGVPGPLVKADPSLAAFVRGPNGAFALGYSGPDSTFVFRPAAFGDYAPPGGLDGLPAMTDRFPPPEMAIVGQLLMGGSSAQQIGRALQSAQGMGSPVSELDATTARFVQDPGGGAVDLAMTAKDGSRLTVTKIPGSSSFPGLASLPTQAQAFPAAH